MFVPSYEVSSRGGMHHFSLFTGAGAASIGIVSCTMATDFVFLAQRQHETIVIGDGAPEYDGAAQHIPAGAFLVQAHAINIGDAPLLVEGWINLATVSTTPRPLSYLGLSAGHKMHVPAHSKQTVTAAAPAIELPMAIVELVGHFHEHTTEQRASVAGKQVYSTTNWAEPTVSWFTSKTGGPLVVQPAKIADASWTGQRVGAFEITPETSIQWECDVDNTLDTDIGFGNQARTSEMCNLQGLVDELRPWAISLP
jgi:hypothetical protein